MVTVVVIEFSGMRCQPLRRALCIKKPPHKEANKFDTTGNQKLEI